MNFEEKTISTQKIYEGRIVKLEDITVELPDGTIAKREVIRHRGASAVVPVDSDGNIIMVRQYRKPVEQVLIEVPAGKLDGDEDPLDCAKRELSEETGYTAKNYKFLTSIYVAAAYNTERIFIYLATDLEKGEAHADEGEFVEACKYSLDDLLEMINQDELRDTKSVVGLLLAKEQLKK